MENSTDHTNVPLQMSTWANRLVGGGQGLRVKWYDAWNTHLDEALLLLPEREECPHDLFRMLVLNKIALQKKFALVTEKNVPVAVVALRKHGQFWVPITQWMLPGFVFPSLEQYEVRALAALGIELEVAWWRMNAPPPDHSHVRHLVRTPTHCMPCSGDPEQFWSDSGKLKEIEAARKKCRDYSVEVDPPGGLEWIIKHWAEKWATSDDDYNAYISDRMIVAHYLASKNKFHALVLMDNHSPISGETIIVHRSNLVLAYNYRKPEYASKSVGTRILDSAFHWAAESAYEKLDLGGGNFDYKKEWAPQDGARWKFQVSPGALYYPAKIIRKGTELGSTIFRSRTYQKNEPAIHPPAGRDSANRRSACSMPY